MKPALGNLQALLAPCIVSALVLFVGPMRGPRDNLPDCRASWNSGRYANSMSAPVPPPAWWQAFEDRFLERVRLGRHESLELPWRVTASWAGDVLARARYRWTREQEASGPARWPDPAEAANAEYATGWVQDALLLGVYRNAPATDPVRHAIREWFRGTTQPWLSGHLRARWIQGAFQADLEKSQEAVESVVFGTDGFDRVAAAYSPWLNGRAGKTVEEFLQWRLIQRTTDELKRGGERRPREATGPTGEPIGPDDLGRECPSHDPVPERPWHDLDRVLAGLAEEGRRRGCEPDEVALMQASVELWLLTHRSPSDYLATTRDLLASAAAPLRTLADVLAELDAAFQERRQEQEQLAAAIGKHADRVEALTWLEASLRERCRAGGTDGRRRRHLRDAALANDLGDLAERRLDPRWQAEGWSDAEWEWAECWKRLQVEQVRMERDQAALWESYRATGDTEGARHWLRSDQRIGEYLGWSQPSIWRRRNRALELSRAWKTGLGSPSDEDLATT